MNTDAVINGHDVVTWDHRDKKIPSHARRFCAALERGHEAVERVDYSNASVTVWMDDDNERAAFEIPDGWRVVRSGVYSGGVAIDLEPEGDR